MIAEFMYFQYWSTLTRMRTLEQYWPDTRIDINTSPEITLLKMIKCPFFMVTFKIYHKVSLANFQRVF